MDRDGLTAMPESGPTIVAEQSAVDRAPAPAPAPAKAPRRNSFRALHSRPFRLYYAGQAVSVSGTFLQQTAIGWLVLEQTGSAKDLGLVVAAGGIPSLLFGPWGGVVADRVDLRKLLLTTQVLFCALAAVLWSLAAAGKASVTALVAIGVAGGVVQIVDSPARQAFVGRLVQPSDLASAVSLNGVVVNGARVVGPALVGILIVTVGTTVCFGINALSYVFVIAALILVRPIQAAGPRPPGTSRRQAGPGLFRRSPAALAPAGHDVDRRPVRLQLRGDPAGAGEGHLPRLRRHLRVAQRDVVHRCHHRVAGGGAGAPPPAALPPLRRARLRGDVWPPPPPRRTSPSPASRSCSRA